MSEASSSDAGLLEECLSTLRRDLAALALEVHLLERRLEAEPDRAELAQYQVRVRT